MAHGDSDSTTTPKRLVDVASRLFAASSVDAVSIRSITREANLGPAAVHYHFKTKDALVDAIIDRHARQVLAEILERGHELLLAPETPCPRQVVECIAVPYFDLLAREPREGAEWLGIVGQLARVEDERITRGTRETTRLIHDLVQRCFPEARPEQRVTATSVAVTSLVTLVGQVQAVTNSPAGPLPTRTRNLVIDFVTGGLERAALGRQ